MTLAGNMKLKNFVMLGAIVAAAGIGGAYVACSGKSEKAKENEQEKLEKAKLEKAKATAPMPPPPPAVDAAVVAPPPPPAGGVGGAVDLAARPYDREALAWQGRSIPGDKVKDASHGKPYKINVYKDAGATTVSRVKIDLDRDEKFDEKISFGKDGTVTLERAPADDEKYTEAYHWNGSGWMKAAVPAEKPDKK